MFNEAMSFDNDDDVYDVRRQSRNLEVWCSDKEGRAPVTKATCQLQCGQVISQS